jgi:NAD(P)-dependent dehydrogenase (short-subunit alcohol dehydrogenase family)
MGCGGQGELQVSHKLQEKLALVTGGSRGIGRSTAMALADEGADVVITYVKHLQAAEETVAQLKAKGVRAAHIRVDLRGTGELDRLVSDFRGIISAWGRNDFHILVNNAGILRLATFDKVTEDDFDEIILTNYKSVFFLTQKLAALLADGGRVINLGSGTARIAFAPLIAYGPIKAAVQSLTLYLAGFLGARGVTVNAVAPGGLDGDFNAPLFAQMPQTKDYIASNTALGRIGSPADVAGAIAFLCTAEASFINGAVLNVDGGYHL